jgi:chromosomal replication initiation ATPase DnaA
MITSKQEKAAAIYQATLAVASFYNIQASLLLSESSSKSKQLNRGRGLLMSHLFRQGMSHVSIGRIVQRSTDTVRTGITRADLDVTADERELMAVLPVIPANLSISKP